MVIVDAYNVLMAEGSGGIDLGDLEQLAAGSRFARRGVLLVCDGVADRPGGTSPVAAQAGKAAKGARIVDAGPGRDADGAIEAMLAADSAPSRFLLVSDDRRLKAAAKRAGASVLSSRGFLARLREDEERGRPAPLPAFATDLPLDRGSVAYWLDHFGVEGEATPEGVASMRAREAPKVDAKARSRSSAKKGGRPEGAGPKKEQDTPARRPLELPGGERVDPVLLDALEEWALGLDDLDMRRWLDGKQP